MGHMIKRIASLRTNVDSPKPEICSIDHVTNPTFAFRRLDREESPLNLQCAPLGALEAAQRIPEC